MNLPSDRINQPNQAFFWFIVDNFVFQSVQHFINNPFYSGLIIGVDKLWVLHLSLKKLLVIGYTFSFPL